MLSDLLTYVGESTTEYLLSVTAASIPRIPADRRVVMFTGPSRSFKTTYGMLLSELGLAPPRNVDFSSEVNGRSGQFRPELANNISQYPMLFVNDPHEPDGTTIKKLCDETQQYESKYVNKRTVYQRATCVFTVNDSMKFRTSAMDAKIPLCDYLDEIHSDGSLVDLWQSIQKTGLAQRWRIVIPQECEDHNKRMQIGSSPLQKWLSGCRPAPEKTAKYFVTIAEAYEDYMVFVNPFTDEYTVKEKLQTKAKAATWKPDPRRDGLEGTSKSDLIKQLQTMGYIPTRLGWNRGFYMRLPEHLDFFTAGGAQRGREKDEVKVIGATTAWEKLFGGDRQVVL